MNPNNTHIPPNSQSLIHYQHEGYMFPTDPNYGLNIKLQKFLEIDIAGVEASLCIWCLIQEFQELLKYIAPQAKLFGNTSLSILAPKSIARLNRSHVFPPFTHNTMSQFTPTSICTKDSICTTSIQLVQYMLHVFTGFQYVRFQAISDTLTLLTNVYLSNISLCNFKGLYIQGLSSSLLGTNVVELSVDFGLHNQ